MRTLILVAATLVLGCTETAFSPLSLDDTKGLDAIADVEFECVTDGDCDDGLFCTVDTCTENGCVHDVEPYFCAIDSVCVPDLATAASKPDGNPCIDCDPSLDAWAWSFLPDGTPAGPGLICMDGEPCSTECVDGIDGCGRPCER